MVQIEPEAVERALIRWMETNELLCIQRQQPGRIIWEPLRGFQAAFRRSTAALGAGTRPFMLSRATTVSATILPLESGYSHVALAADARKIRGEYVGSGAALASVGAAGTATMIALGALLPVALLPLPFALGWATSSCTGTVPRSAGFSSAWSALSTPWSTASPGLPSQLPDRSGLMGLLADEVRKALKS